MQILWSTMTFFLDGIFFLKILQKLVFLLHKIYFKFSSGKYIFKIQQVIYVKLKNV
jgi:hypothetical protein